MTPPAYDLDSDHGRNITRRILANLPPYRSQAAWKAIIDDRTEQGLTKSPPQSYTLEDLTARLDADAHTEALSQEQVGAELADLEAAGLCSESSGKWSMTSAGLDALNA